MTQRQVRIPWMALFRCPDVRGFASRMYQYIPFPRNRIPTCMPYTSFIGHMLLCGHFMWARYADGVHI